MTDHQTARRARKSALFFARHAERAALGGNKAEAQRLTAVALRKNARAKIARALMIIAGTAALAACADLPSPPAQVAVGLDCESDAVRVMSLDSAQSDSARFCRTVEIHYVDKGA